MAYRPIAADYAIVFEERQVASIEANLNINLSAQVMNNKNIVPGVFKAKENTCKVTITDPYLDGIAWTALGEIDRYFLSTAMKRAENGDLLPKCEQGQNPETHKCNKYAAVDTSIGGQADGDSANNPFIIITLFYKLGGTLNQVTEQTFYYRVNGTNITQGESGEPTVNITGAGAYHMSFQQNLQPTFFSKNKNLIDELNEKTDIKERGFEIEDICSTGADQVKVDRNYRINNLTTKEILEKWVKSVEGSQILSLPTKEFANKIQFCSKPDTGCYLQRVFYLGKGLYEKYTINSKTNFSDYLKNYKASSVSEAESETLPEEAVGIEIKDTLKFRTDRKDPVATSQKLRQVNSSAWAALPKQFEDLSDYSDGNSSANNGWIVESATPSTGSGNTYKQGEFVIKKVTSTALFGDLTSPTAFLGGKVTEVGEVRAVVEAPYHILYCVPGVEKCGQSSLFQEYKDLKSVSVEKDKNLVVGESVGEAETDPQKHTKFRYFIKIGRDSNIKEVTIDPTKLQSLISTSVGYTDPDLKDKAPTDDTEKDIGNFIGEVGSTGNSSGPHLHAMWWGQVKSARREIVEADVIKYVEFKGTYTVTSEYNAQEYFRPAPHDGIDLSANEGTGLFVKGGAKILDADRGVQNPGGYGYSVVISTPEGNMLLAHLKAGSIPESIPSIGNGGSGVRSKTGEGSTSGPASGGITKEGITLKTSFKGIPKALSLIPGRTVLSFVTDYDAWVRSNKSNAIDPGVWIPEKYRNWPIVKTTFKWENGDLRVDIECRRPYISRDIYLIDSRIPKFSAVAQEKGYKDYYDYIRSSGDLCFGDSCTKCGNFALSSVLGGTPGTGNGSSTTGANNVTTSYPKGKFTYTCDRPDAQKFQALLNAGSALGVTNKAGLAGIISGALQESGLDPTIISGVAGESSQGIFQWNPAPNVLRLQDLKKWASDQGLDYLDFNTQVNYFVYDVKRSYPNLVPALNSATTPFGAANAFDRNYTISGDRDKGPNWPQNQRRTTFVNDVLKCMTES